MPRLKTKAPTPTADNKWLCLKSDWLNLLSKFQLYILLCLPFNYIVVANYDFVSHNFLSFIIML